jgi:4-amino-4-deoxy-L-arabinose transferase-like glycosyltransferase
MDLRTAAALAFLSLTFLAFPTVSSVWDANEAFYVQTPREMVESGDWLAPTFNSQPRLNKPPLSYWLVAAPYAWFGVDLLWQRLLLGLLAVGCLGWVLAVGRLHQKGAAPLLACAILAATFRFQMAARRMLIDLLLLFLLLGGIFFFLRWVEKNRTADLAAAALCFGLAFLTKGPVALLPLAFLLPWYLYRRRRRAVPPSAVFTAVLIFSAAAFGWFVLLGLQVGWEPVRDFFLRENLGRYATLDYGPRRGPLYYVAVFAGDFFPWSLLFPAAAIWAVRRLRRNGDPFHLFLLGWCAVVFLLFSLSRNKQEYYILPLYPAAALLLADYLQSVRVPAWLRAGAAVPLFAAAAAAVYLGAQLFGDTPYWIPPLLLAAAAGALAAGRFQAAALLAAGFFLAGYLFFLEPLERFKPVRPLAEEMKWIALRKGQSDFIPGYYRFTAPSLRFYLDRSILEMYESEEAVRVLDSDRPVYLLMEENDFLQLQAELPGRLEIVAQRPKLYTTARTFFQGIFSGRIDRIQQRWTRPVYLVSNRPANEDSGRLSDRPGLQ